MAANTPEVYIIDDTDKHVVVKVIGYYTTATTQNTQLFSANTLRGADNTKPCILSIAAVDYSASIANGYVAVEFMGAANQKGYVFGRANDGNFIRYVPNAAGAPTGDINLNQVGLAGSDVFDLVITFVKEFQGTYWNIAAPTRGSGAWANTQYGY